MKKIAKISLVAAVAVAGLTTANAQPLEQAIKGVEVSGSVVYRYNDYNNALIYYERAFKIATENNDLRSINIIYAEKAGLLMNQKKFSETKAFLDKTLHSYPELYKIDSVIPAYLYFLMSNEMISCTTF